MACSNHKYTHLTTMACWNHNYTHHITMACSNLITMACSNHKYTHLVTMACSDHKYTHLVTMACSDHKYTHHYGLLKPHTMWTLRNHTDRDQELTLVFPQSRCFKWSHPWDPNLLTVSTDISLTVWRSFLKSLQIMLSAAIWKVNQSFCSKL